MAAANQSRRVQVSALVAVLALGLAIVDASSGGATRPAGEAAALVPGGSPGYPEEWLTTLTKAEEGTASEIPVPDTPAANAANVQAVYLWPGAEAVALQFPPPGESEVRQQYIEVYVGMWTRGDPSATFTEDLDDADIAGAEVVDLKGSPAIVVPPNPPSDIEQANPAYVSFIIDGKIEVEISGGDDVETLLEIGRWILA